MSVEAASCAAFAQGFHFIREPGFDLWTLEAICSGRQSYRFGDNRYVLQPRTLLVTPPGIGYRLRATAPGEELWIFFDPPAVWLSLLDWPTLPFGSRAMSLPDNETGEEIMAALLDTCKLWETPGRWRARLADNAFERALLLAAASAPEDPDHVRDQRITQALSRMQADLAQPLQVEDLARAAGLSVSRFAHLFRAEMGMPPARYLETLRLDYARDLLQHTYMKIQDVARAVGIPSAAHFSTRFRQHTGQSPTSVRGGHKRASGGRDSRTD